MNLKEALRELESVYLREFTDDNDNAVYRCHHCRCPEFGNHAPDCPVTVLRKELEWAGQLREREAVNWDANTWSMFSKDALKEEAARLSIKVDMLRLKNEQFERLKEWAKERMSLGYFVRVDHVDVPTGKILITHAGGFDDAIAAICKESEDKPC